MVDSIGRQQNHNIWMHSNISMLQDVKRGFTGKTALSVIYPLIVKLVTSQTVLVIDVIIISQDPIAYKVYFAMFDSNIGVC